MKLLSDILITIGWAIRVREARFVERLRQLVTVVFVMASMGMAIGYAIVTRGMARDEDPAAPGETE